MDHASTNFDVLQAQASQIGRDYWDSRWDLWAYFLGLYNAKAAPPMRSRFYPLRSTRS
jgi:hypothetical protein